MKDNIFWFVSESKMDIGRSGGILYGGGLSVASCLLFVFFSVNNKGCISK